MSNRLTVSEDCKTFAMLLDALLARGNKQPPIGIKTIRIYAELARKYDVANLATFCDAFVSDVGLDNSNLAAWHLLADDYTMSEATAHCRKFAVGLNFKIIKRYFALFSRLAPEKEVIAQLILVVFASMTICIVSIVSAMKSSQSNFIFNVDASDISGRVNFS